MYVRYDILEIVNSIVSETDGWTYAAVKDFFRTKFSAKSKAK